MMYTTYRGLFKFIFHEYSFAGPGTVLCDDLGYVFMFLSIATSNLVATALAGQVSLFKAYLCYETR